MNDCEDLIICDLAETYGIYDYRMLPPKTVATLVLGLREDSRVMMKISKARLSYKDSILALIFDGVLAVNYKLGHKKGQEKPKSLYKKLTEVQKKDELRSFRTPEEYEKWRKEHTDG